MLPHFYKLGLLALQVARNQLAQRRFADTVASLEADESWMCQSSHCFVLIR
jgi:hypothetical protein